MENTYICPGIEYHREPRSRVNNGPVDDSNQEWKCYDGGIENGVQSLQWARPSLQQRSAGARIREGVQAAEEEIEGQAPICEIGKVRKTLTREVEGMVRSVPAKDEEGGGEGVEREKEAEASQDRGREEPGGREAVSRVEGGGRAHETVYGLHVGAPIASSREVGFEDSGQPLALKGTEESLAHGSD